jgi:hypothetical protein
MERPVTGTSCRARTARDRLPPEGVAAQSATAPVSHAFRNDPAAPTVTTAAITSVNVSHGGARSIDRLDSNASTTFACTSGQ